MSEARDPPAEESLRELPQALAAPPRRAGLSFIWLVPLVAALIGGWLAVRAVLERGPTISVSFATAEGLEPGKTKVRYKNVEIGELTRVAFSADRTRIAATVELKREAEPLLVEDTRFWVVRPRVVGGQISGLTTLLSGAYIGIDPGRSAEPARQFVGLETPPIVTLGLPGRHFDLKARDLGSLDIGSPVYLRWVRVGQVVAFELDADGGGVTVKIFVNAPHDRFVGPGTRFWQASGLDLTVDAGGIKLDTESLATLALGGIAFESPAEMPAAGSGLDRSVYRLFSDRASAMKQQDGIEERYVVVFDESVRGLQTGAPVDFRGVVIGEVAAIDVDSRPERGEVRIPVEIRLYPQRLSRRGPAAEPYAPEGQLVDRLVARGLRAQLRTGNPLTGQLYVALDFFPRSAQARIDRGVEPPRIPAVPGRLVELQDTLRDLAQRLKEIPVEALAADLRKTLASADQALRRMDKTLGVLDATLGTADAALRETGQLARRLETDVAPELGTALADARRVLSSAERVLAADAPVQHDLRETLRQVARAAEALRVLADYLERNPDALLRGRRTEP